MLLTQLLTLHSEGSPADNKAKKSTNRECGKYAEIKFEKLYRLKPKSLAIYKMNLMY